MVVVLPLETSQATSDTPADVHGPSSDQRPTVRVEDQAPRSEERPTSASTSRSGRAEHPAARRLAAPKRTEEGEEKGAAGQKGQQFRSCPISWCRENFYKKGHIFGCHYPTALAKEDNLGSEERKARIIRVRAIALRYLARILVGPEASIDDLVCYLNNGRLMGREECSVDEWTRRVAIEVAEELELPVPDTFTCVPLNSPGVIFQYKIMMEVIGLLSRQEHEDFLHAFLSEHCLDPDPDVVVIDKEGGSDVAMGVQGEMEADVSSIPADRGLEVEKGVGSMAVDTPIQEEDGVSSTSVDSRQVVIPVLSESSTSTPRRPWLPGRSPVESVNLSDMGVVDEVTKEEPAVMEAPRRVHFEPVAPFRLESVDSHFHLDRLCARLGVRPVNYAETLRRVRSGSEEYFKPDGAVAVLCDPLTYPTKRQVSQLRKRRVVSDIGIHPGNVVEGDVERLATMLDTYEVVGLGDVGLDGTKGDPELQRRTLDEALVLLKTRPHLVLVLHCRPGPRENITSAYYELFYRCKGILSPEQRIHLHCFNRTLDDVSLWLGYFPNTYFGYSLMVTRRDFQVGSITALRRID
ncbi:hypothetical protein DPMN_176798 [Dreissena polymorpha]|uniref:Uncharacterized protein n=1 Tax=Dreissena polymorpha TaxID=45954 RepID=A0A9D4E8Z8_DREPO|nr:hypothetical protein DPMN_176798 [Dreissena polymorpha]